MNPCKRRPFPEGQRAPDGRNDEFGHKIAIWLSEEEREIPHEIAARLREGRLRALANCKQAPQQASWPFALPAFLVLLPANRHWVRLGSLVPLVVLIVGLAIIGGNIDDRTAQAEADVDAQLLTDVLPPSAYIDAGFREFLRPAQRRQSGREAPSTPNTASTDAHHA